MQPQSQRRLFDDGAVPGLVPQPPPARLMALLREHRRLLTDVASKRRTVARLLEDIRQVQTRVAPGLAVIAEGMRALDREIHKLFAILLTPRRLPRRMHQQVELFYEELQRAQILAAPAPTAADIGDDSEEGDDDDVPGAADRVGPSSAARPPADEGGRLRELFRRLAAALHPDRAQDLPDQAARTEAMKEVNRAYRAGDLAALLQVERTWMDATPLPERPEEVELRCRQLQGTNEQLRQQLRELRLEIRDLRTSEPGRLARDAKKFSASVDPVASFLAEGQGHVAKLTRLRDDLRRFEAGELSFIRLVQGPLCDDDQEEDADLFEEAVAILQELTADRPRKRRARR